MNATVVTVPNALYPHRPSCACGQQFRGYAAKHAAQLVADEHRCEVSAADVLTAPIGAVVMVEGKLVKASGAWSAEAGRRAEKVADPALDLSAWRVAMGSHETAMLTADGRTVARNRWCTCGPAATVNPVRYESWTAAGREAHGWACSSCRGVVQTG